MTVKNDFSGHRTFAAWARYELPDQKVVTGRPQFWLFHGDTYLGLRTPKEVQTLVAALTPPGKTPARDGVPWVITAPADVALAMKDTGLMGTAREGYRFFSKVLRPTLRETTLGAFGRATKDGKPALEKVTPYYVVSAGAGTRDGRASLEFNVYALDRAEGHDGKVYQLDHRKMAYTQAPAQAAANQALGRALLKRGVLIVPDGKSSVTAVGYKADTPGADRVNATAANGRRTPRPTAASASATAATTATTATGATAATTATASSARSTKGARATTARPTRTARPAAAGPKARQQNRRRTAGPRAKKAAAKKSRPRKRAPVAWTTALANLTGTVNAILTKTVRDSLVRLDRTGQRWLARRAIKAAYRYHVGSGAARFSDASVKATGRALATPHVSVGVFNREWAKLSADPVARGCQVVKVQPTGGLMLAPAAQVGLEQKLGKKLAAAARARTGGLAKKKVVKALAGTGLTTAQYLAAVRVAGPGRVAFAGPARGQALEHAVRAFRRHRRDVYVLGDKGLAKQLGGESFSVNGFLQSTRRASHLSALWTGLTTECWLTGSPLRAAELARAAKPRVRLKKGSVVVVSPKGPDDARAVERLLALCEKRNCKLVVAGPHAAQFQSLSRGRGMTP